jgi:hypothetical protein
MEASRYVEEYRRTLNGVTLLAGRDALDTIRQHSTETTPVLGVDRDSRPVTVDLDTESPHVLFSIGTGAGKSATLRLLLAQFLWHGAEICILDYKRHSHRWARHFPDRRRITYCRDPSDMHENLIALAALGMKRNRIADKLTDEQYDSGLGIGRRVVIACEELNSTAVRLKQHWRAIGGKGTSPALEALGEVLAMGRAVKLNVLAVAQRASATAVGGGDARENYRTRVLAGHTKRTWDMLCDGVGYVAASEIPGRVIVVRAGRATETQVAFLTDSPDGGDTVKVATGEWE